MVEEKKAKIDINEIFKFTICSSVIGVAVSYWDFYLFHLMMIISFAIIILKYKESFADQKELKIKINRQYYPFIAALSWYMLTIIWAPNIVYALKYIFYIICGFSIIFFITKFSRSEARLEQLFRSLRLLFITQMIIALLESINFIKMPISRYSDLAPFFGKSPQLVFEEDFSLSYLLSSPPTGFHWDTNELSLALLIIFPFFLCYEKIVPRSIGIISIIILIIMSASRAVFFGILIVSLFYFLLIKKKLISLILISITSMLMIIGIISLNNSDNPNINEIANSTKTAYLYLTGDINIDQSLNWRRELVDNGLRALYETNGLGVGAGGSVAVQEKVGKVDGRFTSMHNFWVEILVEGGVIFFILFFMWYIKILIKLFVIGRSRQNTKLIYFSNSVFLSMVGFIPGAITSSSTIYFFPMWLMLGFAENIIFLFEKNYKIKLLPKYYPKVSN